MTEPNDGPLLEVNDALLEVERPGRRVPHA